MWGFYPSYFDFFEKQFDAFLKKNIADLKSEYYIPTLIDQPSFPGSGRRKVLHCDAEWFGVTYPEDKEFVSERLNRLIEEGVYGEKLWA
jgi:hypothetical protein